MRLPFLLAASVAGSSATFTPQIVSPSAITKVATSGNSSLFEISAPGYSSPFRLVDLRGDSRHALGFAYGQLLGPFIPLSFESLYAAVIGNSTIEKDVLDAFLLFEFDAYVSKHTPKAYLDEVQGVIDGAQSVGVNVASLVRKGIVISAIATGDVTFDIETLLRQECLDAVSAPLRVLCRLIPTSLGRAPTTKHEPLAEDSLFDAGVRALAAEVRAVISTLARTRAGCSHFGVWGRSVAKAGTLFTGRNLDWLADTGLAAYKTLEVWHVPRSELAAAAAIGVPAVEASVGLSYAGLMFPLAGMSSAGLTVHEAGDDNHDETLRGVPWTIRLRQTMETAPTLQVALERWADVDNTLGINHGIGCAACQRYAALEVKANYTAVFFDDDARERESPYGSPLPDAVWRTNHGYCPDLAVSSSFSPKYDPTWLSTAAYTKPDADSLTRYQLMHDVIVEAISAGGFDELRAVNLTAIPADKGGSSRDSFLRCGPGAAGGINVLSVTFEPVERVMFVAYEDGRGASHVPAACNPYVRFDMKPYFAPSQP